MGRFGINRFVDAPVIVSADEKILDENGKNINMDFEGLQEIIARLIAGEEIEVRTNRFANDFERLLEDTIAGNADAVAKAIEEIRGTQYAPAFCNDEQALRYVIKFAYIAAVDQYLKVEELPSGKGIADVVYLPKPKSLLPALVVELRWNKSSEGASQQIKERNYPAVLKDCICRPAGKICDFG